MDVITNEKRSIYIIYICRHRLTQALDRVSRGLSRVCGSSNCVIISTRERKRRRGKAVLGVF